ncbi:MAG: hypothetical protein ACK5H1_01485 [Tenacibaculum sp.]
MNICLNSWLKESFFWIFNFSIGLAFAQEQFLSQKTLGYGQLNFLSIDMPEGEANMDFAGLHYNLKINHLGYIGIGFYGAVGGIRGGFFSLGVNAGMQKYLSQKLFIDTGIHFGGGGGVAAPDGGGAFILPHINLGYQFKHFSTTAGYSYINFFDGGAIKSSQLAIAVQVPLAFNVANFSLREKEYNFNSMYNNALNTNSKPISLLFHLNNANITKGNYKGKTISLAGIELSLYLLPRFFFFAKADGAYHGIKAGYMDIFIGGGYELSINKNRTNLLAKFGLGAGGGGGVDTRGGLLFYPDFSLQQKLFNNVYASVNKGYIITPNSNFTSSTYGMALKYYLNKKGTTTARFTKPSKAKLKGLKAAVKQDLYLNAQREGGFSQNLHQISLQVNFFFNKYIYGIGQTSFANFGNAGAYAEGIIGLGLSLNNSTDKSAAVFVQILSGAAGGGGISTGQGLIVKPSIGVDYKLSKYLSLRVATGRVKAISDRLNAQFFNLGISYRLAFLSIKS